MAFLLANDGHHYSFSWILDRSHRGYCPTYKVNPEIVCEDCDFSWRSRNRGSSRENTWTAFFKIADRGNGLAGEGGAPVFWISCICRVKIADGITSEQAHRALHVRS
jgi:hypothetical protein